MIANHKIWEPREKGIPDIDIYGRLFAFSWGENPHFGLQKSQDGVYWRT